MILCVLTVYYYLKNKKIHVCLIQLDKRIECICSYIKFMKQKSKRTYVSIPHALLAELKYSN